MNKEELLKEMESILETKGEKALEAFVLEHFTELPEEVQSKTLMSFYAESLAAQAGDVKIAALQKQGIETLTKIAELKAEASSAPLAN